jgi:hypothetical protein
MTLQHFRHRKDSEVSRRRIVGSCGLVTLSLLSGSVFAQEKKQTQRKEVDTNMTALFWLKSFGGVVR